ncbi:hypothetical protein QJS10_CPB12g01114 [Acorus calamus]|uniref:RRM domain-containing protein n=1 Tax=Acorus calamus TaxID=4465 RepID=A0AAV9DNQ2_ACOCL|nr:hypothetical protein QJS10_CPB12g01114 [Acorus calamus]
MDPSNKKRKSDENGISSAAFDGVFPDLTKDDITKIIDPFTRDQLADIVSSVATRSPDLLSAIRSIADRDTTQRKLFIRGLGWDTTTDGLRSLFSAYGDLDEAVVIMDKSTGKSKGYGFITFHHIDGALLALKEPSKKIDGRMTIHTAAFALPTFAMKELKAYCDAQVMAVHGTCDEGEKKYINASADAS